MTSASDNFRCSSWKAFLAPSTPLLPEVFRLTRLPARTTLATTGENSFTEIPISLGGCIHVEFVSGAALMLLRVAARTTSARPPTVQTESSPPTESSIPSTRPLRMAKESAMPPSSSGASTWYFSDCVCVEHVRVCVQCMCG